MKKIIYILLLCFSASFAQHRSALGNPLCSEEKALIAQMTTQPMTDAYKQNWLIQILKNDTIWSIMDVLYGYASPTSQAATLNWKSPGTYTATLVNSPTFTAYEGFAGNSSNMYINNNFNTSTNSVNYTQNDACHFVYQRANVGTSATDAAGCCTGAVAAGSRVALRWTDGKIYGFVNNASSAGLLNYNAGDARGLTAINRSGATACQIYRNGSSVSTSAEGTISIPSFNDYVLCSNDNGTASRFSSTQVSFRGYSASLSAYRQLRLSNDINGYMTLYGKNVY